ncbi:MAG: NAD-dependent epimerase/dehydratase family protein [Planctomycetota bacterium]|nr:NAD-dependent epimerase/dehydratase family protein [Planctomycetota bacterium]
MPPSGFSRRSFLGSSVASAALLAAGAGVFSRAQAKSVRALAEPAERKLKILILGGTGFLGPACIDAALARGHTLTLFNRGKTEERRKQAGRDSVVPDGVEVLYGNRDPNKTAGDENGQPATAEPDPASPKGLSALEGKTWDGVIDTSGYWPRMVRASASLLAPNVKQYVFISTLSVYAKNDTPDKAEDAELATLTNPETEDFGAQFENYGAGKAACEKAAEEAMPGRVTNVRPGFIVGPRDPSRRYMYWPVRASRGGDMIVPGKPGDPFQFIDVRDLAEFIVHCLENGTVGAFNTVTPARSLTMENMVLGCTAAAKSLGDTPATPTWLPADFLQANAMGTERFPLWIPPEGEAAGFHQRSSAKAVAAGLKFRSPEDTAKVTLAFYKTLPPQLQERMLPPMVDPAEEARLIKLYSEKK